MPDTSSRILGPILVLDDVADGVASYAALFIASEGVEPGAISLDGQDILPQVLARFDSGTVLRARFSHRHDAPFAYRWQGRTYDVAGAFGADLRIAYASCNGEEHGDLDRPDTERNVMWARLRRQHEDRPFALLLHGGDQVYADEVTKGHPLSDDWPDTLPRDPSRADLQDLRHHLREGFFARYRNLYAAPDLAWLAARVPSLMQWDDHDICDGWGSLKRSRTYSPVGQMLFEVAREACLLFQHATVDGDLPGRFADAEGLHLGWSVHVPGLHIVAPDLRGQRTRREVMGESGWAFLERAVAASGEDQLFVMSSVPLLGPRLSLFELALVVFPKMQKYEDDLRDQWQSRAHRASWVRALRTLSEAGGTRNVVALSGEIHLATRAEMPIAGGRTLHQLVASGVTHRPPPKAWARLLGAVARWGQSPLPGQPIRIRPLPGRSARYTAERNTLSLERSDGAWSARWDLEETGPSPALVL